MSHKLLSWTPRRHGNTYCAPACGRGCTLAEYVAANKLAASLAKKLGASWKPVVHENMGWHGRASRGVADISLYGFGLKGYFANINGMWTADGKTPRAAFLAALAKANAERKHLNELVDSLGVKP